MATTGTVGILRALLTADATAFQSTMKKSADAATGFGKSMTSLGNTAQRVSPQLTRLEKSFQGDKLLYTANNLTRAITNIGGAAKLTAREQEKVNQQLTEAIAKYKALGQTAPKAMVDLEKATRNAATATGGLTTKMIAIGTSIGTFVGRLAYDAVKRLAGGVTDLAARGLTLAPVVTAFERLTAAAGQSGEEMLQITRTATKGLITDLDIMAAANKALLLGLPVTADEFGVLAQAATALGKAMKLDAKQSLDDFITALGRSSPQILDNLGLTVKLGEANDAYKQQLGIVGRELTENEKKLAFYNAAVDAAKRKTEELGGVQLTVADQFTRARVAMTNLTDAMGIAIARSPVVAELLGGIADEITTAFGTNQVKLVQSFTGVVNDLAISLTDVGVAAIEMGRLTSRVWVFLKDGILGLLETQFRVRAGLRDLIPLERYRQEARELRAMADSLKKDVEEAYQGQLRLEGGLDAASEALGRIRGRMSAAATQGTNLAQVADDVAMRTKGLGDANEQTEADIKKTQAAIDAQRRSLEAIGIVTLPMVTETLKEFTIQEQRATKEGVDLDRVLIAQLPKLKELVDKAKASGISVAGLAAAYARAGDAMRRTLDLRFDIPSPELPQVVAATADELERLNRVAGLPAWKDLPQVVGTWSDELERAARAVSPEQWRVGALSQALQRMGIESQQTLDHLAQQAQRDYELIAQAAGESSREAAEAWERMIEAQLRASHVLETYFWRSFVPSIERAWTDITGAASHGLFDMLIVTQKFKEGFLDIWRSIRQAFANILADMLQDFLQGFLKRMLAAIARQQLARALGGAVGGALFGGAVGAAAGGGAAVGGGLLASSSLQAAVTMGAVPSTGLAAGGAGGAAAAGGAGFGATMLALASNPITWGVAAAALLGWGIWKKGWLRGGEEGAQVNPARDRFLRQFGPPGTGEGSGFHTLASLLTQLTGQPGGGSLFRALTSADTMKEFTAATRGIMTLLQRRGVPVPAPSGAGHVHFPANPLPALAAATRSASQAPVPVAAVPTPVPGLGGVPTAAPVTMNVTIQAWDRADLNTAFRDEIIPRFKDALQFNQAGLRTAVAGV